MAASRAARGSSAASMAAASGPLFATSTAVWHISLLTLISAARTAADSAAALSWAAAFSAAAATASGPATADLLLVSVPFAKMLRAAGSSAAPAAPPPAASLSAAPAAGLTPPAASASSYPNSLNFRLRALAASGRGSCATWAPSATRAASAWARACRLRALSFSGTSVSLRPAPPVFARRPSASDGFSSGRSSPISVSSIDISSAASLGSSTGAVGCCSSLPASSSSASSPSSLSSPSSRLRDKAERREPVVSPAFFCRSAFWKDAVFSAWSTVSSQASVTSFSSSLLRM
mmetsp:Transcript_91675/g.259519  ORF Transcript_91675/g.259519 Transcript_91675/m.259519 type:complete len:291 (-) Transcript_91675:422-1294(-)